MVSSKFSRRTRIQGLPPICKKPPIIIEPPVIIPAVPCQFCNAGTTPRYLDIVIANMPAPWTMLAGPYTLDQDPLMPCTWVLYPWPATPAAYIKAVKQNYALTGGIYGLTTTFAWSVKDPTPYPEDCRSNFPGYPFTAVPRWELKMKGAQFWIHATH